MAAAVPTYLLYEAAVQGVETPLSLMETSFRKMFGREALNLREDFCGSAYLAAYSLSSPSTSDMWANTSSMPGAHISHSLSHILSLIPIFASSWVE